ncbi:TIGR01777 family protein [Phycicoccus endophyticus]|uniref:TIGR01777 family protein n=1 Tax=Phycicoccus endophyticus TaxID=1690220 RepID=A0A7G9R516_9MICO|nr:TIGR01777 family oxidoreductase [Phycicoccus endophyticus]NHI20917.1 TIGR01777 family protein [Phycicoccus endophyticus]QNN50691.1 TIGR01777 family protein [Phycicoccus endophyticus]GGL22243.1 epimerase [Phycicoccus endophyticus]
MARVAVTGSSGLIGTALVAALRARGDDVLRLVRREPAAPDEVRWDPATRRLDPAVLDGVDAVVNLAGAGVGDHRWSPAYKREILASRTDATTAVATAVAATGAPVRLVSGSAVGFYGDRGDQPLTEADAAGTGFLAEVVLAWEAAAGPAVEAGAPVAFARTGIVMAAGGGAMAPLLRLARLGLGGPLGSGRQFWPWVTLVDEVRALVHLVDRPDVTGAVNLTGPAPARQREVAAALGRALHRPAVLPAPSLALRAVVGEFAGEILGSQRIVGEALLASGFVHEHADLDAAARWLVA